MKVLITGNSGYIGSHLNKLLSSDFEVYGLDKKIPNYNLKNFYLQDINEPLSKKILDEEFDCVVHLAAEVSVSESVNDPSLYYTTNIFGTLNLLNNIKTKNFVCASTGAAEGLQSPYGLSKKAMEEIVVQHCTNKIPFTIFRFYNVIGSDGALPTNPDGLFFNLIRATKTGNFNLYGNDYNTPDGTCIRDYVHVNEICHSLRSAIFDPSNSIENLGHGYGTSVKEIIEIFKEINLCNFDVTVNPRRPGDIEVSVLNNPSRYMQKLYSIKELLKAH